MKIIINNIDFSGSVVDGPGVRTVVYLQGCEQYCVDCHNPQTWNKKEGITYDIEELANLIQSNSLTKKITISGGEPLLQPKQVLALLKELRDFNIALYTGYSLKAVPKEIIENIDYLKVGPYIKELRSSTLPYIGSSNQTFYRVIKGDLYELNSKQ
ncbi:radical SAM protein [Bacillus sp. AFS006103]|nr:radical SAM protein [Bacillus sp. AFS006103]